MENRSRRRESFVDKRRKSLTLTNIFSDENEDGDGDTTRHSMRSYLESLTREKDDWKRIYKQKKQTCKQIEERCQTEVAKIQWEDIEARITEGDRLFLESRPDYLEMVHSVQKYMDSVNYLNKYKSDVIDYYNKACNEIEINNKYVIDKMCSDDDLCDICSIKNCQNPQHVFNSF